MKKGVVVLRKRTVLFFSGVLFILFYLSVSVSAADAEYAGASFDSYGFSEPSLLSDGDDRSHTGAENGGSVTVTREDGISFLYVVFDRLPERWTLTDVASGASAECGENAYLHEYVDVDSKLGSAPTGVRLDFPAGASIDEIYAFGAGEVPDWVQRWSPPCERADLLLLSSHSDDEQLFFAGVLPIYAGERGLNVQVVYLVNHFINTEEYARLRPHEQLDGLWTVGVRNYPVMSEFPDLYSESLDDALAVYGSYGFEYDDFTEFITGVLRRFKPLVVVSHDVDGEYGHGTHILCSEALRDSVDFASDASKFPGSAELYGTWETEKTYLHLYRDNPITLDLDTPLSAFGGKSAFEVTRDGFAKHKSQHWTWFYGWIYGEDGQTVEKATDIEKYSPCYYGLYSTTVGIDSVGGDFMENVIPYSERALEDTAATDQENIDGGADDPESVDKPGETENTDAEKNGMDRRKTVAMIVVVALVAVIGAMICLVLGRPQKKRKRVDRRYR